MGVTLIKGRFRPETPHEPVPAQASFPLTFALFPAKGLQTAPRPGSGACFPAPARAIPESL